MNTTPLNYTITPPRPARKLLLRAAYCIAAISILIAVVCVTITTSREMDPITGSSREQTYCNFGIKSSTHVRPSPLAIRLKKMTSEPPATWKGYGHESTGLLNGVRACGKPPPIFEMLPCMQDFVDHSTDSEIRQFVQTMQSGTPAQQSRAIKAAIEKAWPDG